MAESAEVRCGGLDRQQLAAAAEFLEEEVARTGDDLLQRRRAEAKTEQQLLDVACDERLFVGLHERMRNAGYSLDGTPRTPHLLALGVTPSIAFGRRSRPARVGHPRRPRRPRRRRGRQVQGALRREGPPVHDVEMAADGVDGGGGGVCTLARRGVGWISVSNGYDQRVGAMHRGGVVQDLRARL